MSARMFFQRFANLYTFILDEVTSVARIIKQTPNALTSEESAVYPNLIILAKLQPIQALDKENEKFQVGFFSMYT